MTARAVEQLSQQIFEGRSNAEVQPLVDEVFESLSDNDSLVALYKHLPRPLTGKYIEKVLKADANAEVAQLLLTSDFEGLDEFQYAKRPSFFLKLVDQVLQKVTAKGAQNTQAQKWRLYLLESKSTEVDLESHAVAAMKSAVQDPKTFVFEPLVDATEGIALKAQNAKLYVALLKDVLVAGSGSAGLEKFQKSAGSFLNDEGIASETERKSRLLSFCSFLKADTVVSFDDIKKNLGLDSDAAVESAVVDASLARIIDAAVNKEERSVQVHYVEHLKFDTEAWKQLAGQLAKWKSLTDKCIDA